MPSDDEWIDLIREAAARRLPPLRAIEYRKRPFGSFASPPLLACNDGGEYWVKHPLVVDTQAEGMTRSDHACGLIADHVIGCLAMQLGVEAVPPVRLVDITDLAATEPRLSAAGPGLAHGSKNAATNCTGRLDLAHAGYCGLPMNRSRVAELAILYGLAYASDHQVIYRVGGDPLVFSVDHGHFLHGGPSWTADTLAQAPVGQLDPTVITACGVTALELATPLRRLTEVTVAHIAECVATPPVEWPFSEDDRVAVARYLWGRRHAILTAVT